MLDIVILCQEDEVKLRRILLIIPSIFLSSCSWLSLSQDKPTEDPAVASQYAEREKYDALLKEYQAIKDKYETTPAVQNEESNKIVKDLAQVDQANPDAAHVKNIVESVDIFEKK